MDTPHTPDLLHIESEKHRIWLVKPNGGVICSQGVTTQEGKDHAERSAAAMKTMRRLVACWNACEGISTKRLERAANNLHGKASASDRLDELRAQRDHFQALAKDNGQVIIKTACELADVKAQRDVLLTLLSQAVKLYETYGLVAGNQPCGKWVNDSRAAIAQSTGVQG